MRIFAQQVAVPDDVFALRQRTRELAALAGLEESDQVRLATALSEIGRDLLTAGGGEATFAIDEQGDALTVTIDGLGPAGAGAPRPGVQAAGRLIPNIRSRNDAGGRTIVELRRSLPQALTSTEMRELGATIAARVLRSPLDELRVQNQELVTAYERLQGEHTQVVALNAELEETNAGVMAMYTQLSEELETTNRGVVALYADLDDTTRQLRLAMESKTRFLNSVSHELRGPVNSVIALAKLLLDPFSPPLPSEQDHQVGLIRKAGEDLLELVNQLLDLARAESGKVDVTIGPCDVLQAVHEVADGLRPLARHGVTLDVSGAPVTIETDGALLRQILRNLIANALSFTVTGGVSVSVRLEATELIAEVSDTGIGIAEEDLGYIFEEFFQVRNSLQSSRRGSGLGLPYSRRVAELLGGTLDAASTPGTGSRFVLRLPVRQGAAPAPEPPAGRIAGRGRVLIVDDDAGFRSVLARLLAPHAAEIVEAADGRSALQMLHAQPFDVVMLDLVMPDLGGADVIAAMGREPTLRDLPVIVITSMNLESVAVRSIGQVLAVIAKQDLDAGALARALQPLTADRPVP